MLVNGQHQDSLPIADRAVHYGDGVFETILIKNQQAVLWQQHLQRLRDACQRLSIPLDIAALEHEAQQIIATHKEDCVLKIIVSRGCGGRGYAPPSSPNPSRILQIHPLAADYTTHPIRGIKAWKCHHPLSANPVLAGIKHLNRLDQVMASCELPADYQEGLMCDLNGHLVEGIKSNVFLRRNDRWMTPELDMCGVAGIMRAWLLTHADQVHVGRIPTQDVLAAQEMFVCNSVFGIWPVVQLQWGSERREFEIGKQTKALQALLQGCMP